MKTIRTKFLSLLLALVTILSLLPTAAFAASNTGSGLKITTNQAYWSTRLLANGTPYSYRPPLVDGKLVYCMDSGLGYHYATSSYLNSFTWTSGTGADADAVLQLALTNSGLSEMDAATVENVKWMMTYLNDCKESNVGQLFMAVQTYVWENQSYKGEPGGDGDAGGYANADTYDLYLSLIDWLLEQKAQEDAEFQRQIEEFTAQGKSASIVEDESAKWAVYAISSNRKNQSFFNYYGPRKLVTQDKPGGGGEEPAPPAGVGKIVLKKTAGGTTTGLAGARFSIYFNGQIVGSDITNAQGEIYVENAATGLWSFVETAAPDGYCVDPTPKSVYVDVTEGDREYTVAAVNYEKPDMKIIKRDAMSGKPIVGTVFSVKSVTGNYSTSVTTGTDGSATLSAIPAGVYVVREESVPEPYIVSNTEQTVALRPGKISEVTFVDYEKPGLEIVKKNIANGEPIEGVTFRIEQIDGSFSTSATTDNHGRIFLDSVPVGTFKVTEINVPSHVILCPIPQEVALKSGETSTVTFFNALKPSLEIRKVDSVTGNPIKGAKFQIWYGSNHTDTGELNDLGTYFSDASGKIILPEIKDGWYKVTELEAPHGYSIKEPATQECFISGGESKVLTFENTPLSAIIIRKVDSESGQPLEGAWFRIRYLGGTSGTGGTVIGEYRTSSNGTIVVTSLKAGTYVCEEISAPDGYVITDATETVYLSGKDQDVITVTFGNDKMGSLLIVKKDAVTGAPISDVEFLVTDSDGSVIGTANGKYVTDSAGTIRIDGLTPGMTVIAREVRAKDGYILDDTPQSISLLFNIETLKSVRLSNENLRQLIESTYVGTCGDKMKRMNKIMAELENADLTGILKESYKPIFSPTIVLSHACNYRCTYCFESDYIKSGRINPEQISNIEVFNDQYALHYGIEKKYEGIAVVGGEPFLPENRKTIMSIHEHWHDQRFQYTTNGTNILQYADILKKAKSVKLKVSLDGTPEIHFDKRKTEARQLYDRTIEGLRWAISEKIDTTVISIFQPEFVDSYSEYFDMMERMGWRSVSNLHLAFILKMDSGCDDINRDYLMATNDALKKLKKKDGRISEVFITKLVPGALSLYRALEMRSNGQRISAYACEALFSPAFTFAPDGYVYFCNASRSKNAIVGQFFPEVRVYFDAIEKLKQRNILNMVKCQGCKFRFVCGGGCPVSSIAHYDDVNEPYCAYWNDEEVMNLFENVLL